MPTLDWIGKQAVVNHDKDVPFRLLKRDQKLSVGDSQNLLVKGDNLEALKALMPYYVGKVKCVYIDPPYNTGKEGWVYNDSVTSPEIKRWLGKVVGAPGEDLSRHDKWLCMMFPRLKLLQHLLRDDGVIFVSINDQEVHHLKILMNEIFGENNFVGMAAREMKKGANRGTHFSPSIDFVLCYAKQLNSLPKFNEILSEDYKATFKLNDDDGKGAYKLNGLYEPTLDFYKNCRYLISCPDGAKVITPEGKSFRCNRETFVEKLQRKEIVFKKTKTKLIKENGEPAHWNVYQKLYLNAMIEKGRRPADLLLDMINAEGTQSLGDVGLQFSFSKPPRLIEYLLSISQGREKDYIVLDSFAGSGTTGHAVMRLNKADGGNRRFVLVEMEEHIAKTITAKRLEKLATGYEIDGEKFEALGGGFQFMRLDATLFDAQGDINEPVTWMDLARYVFFTDTQRDLTEKKAKSPYIGSHDGTDYYLLFHERGKNTLTREALATMNGTGAPQRVVYADRCLVPEAVLGKTQTTFKQIPYSVRLF